MAELFDVLQNLFDDDLVGAIGRRVGLEPEKASEAVGVGLPSLLGGLTNHARQPDGANELLDRIRATDGAGGGLDRIVDRLKRGEDDPDDDSAGFLERILGGGDGGGILGALTSRLGLGKGAAGGLLGALLPMVLGGLGKLGGLGGLSPSRLLGFLTDGTTAAADAAPGGRAGVAGLLGPIGAALGLGGAGVAAAAAATPDVAAASTTPTPPPPPPAPEQEERDRRAGGFPWWLLAAAVLVLGLIIAFASDGCNDDDNVATPPTTTATAEPSGPVTDETPARFLTARATGPDGVVLDGPVADDPTKSALGDAAGVVFGVDKVDNRLRVESGATGPTNETIEATLSALAAAPRGWTAIWGSAGELTLVGEVASDADKAAIVAAATAAFAPGTVIDQLTVSATPTPDPAPAPEIDEINKEIRLRGVNFVTGSAELTAASRTTLDRIATILSDAPEVRAQVQGHTDNQGDAAANQALSQRRAASVVTYLVGKGIARNRLVPRGFGESRPVATNATDAGRARNRRVVFRAL